MAGESSALRIAGRGRYRQRGTAYWLPHIPYAVWHAAHGTCRIAYEISQLAYGISRMAYAARRVPRGMSAVGYAGRGLARGLSEFPHGFS